jgi:hypothetical protein
LGDISFEVGDLDPEVAQNPKTLYRAAGRARTTRHDRRLAAKPNRHVMHRNSAVIIRRPKTILGRVTYRRQITIWTSRAAVVAWNFYSCRICYRLPATRPNE